MLVWDQGINYLLRDYIEPMGVEFRGIASAEFDPFGYTPEEWKINYAGKSWYKIRLMTDIIRRAQGCDLVHVHSLDSVVPILKILGFPVLLHYHGSDIRGRWKDRRRYWCGADRVLVSTSDLLVEAPKVAEYQPNPIDIKLFNPSDSAAKEEAALHFDYGAVDIAELIAGINHIPLRLRKKGVPHSEMPGVLRGYTHYVDVKRDYSDRVLISRPTDSGSLIGLQALACGSTVLTLTGKRVGLPPQHRPENVANRVLTVYEEMLE